MMKVQIGRKRRNFLIEIDKSIKTAFPKLNSEAMAINSIKMHLLVQANGEAFNGVGKLKIMKCHIITRVHSCMVRVHMRM